ncbi:PAS domain S-box protein [Candidatus Peregrinibacteria bacterium]|nr:PAS domain S-box protein [Candidatus Peregrinibacteria bacterium]
MGTIITQRAFELDPKVAPHKREDREILERVTPSISIAEAMNECLWLGDSENKTIYVNPVFEKLLGYTLEECIGKHADYFLDDNSRDTVEQHHELRTKGMSSQYEVTLKSKTGKKIPVLISGAPTQTGGTIGILINLTKVKKLEQQEKINQQILKHSHEAIVILSKSRRIKLWNHGAAKMFGYKESEVLNKSIDIIIPDDQQERNLSFLEEVEKKNHIRNIETQRMDKNGTRLDVYLSVTKVTDDNKNLIGYLVIYRDITLQKRANTELQKRFEAIQDAYRELGLQKRQLDYLSDIVDLAVSKCELEELENLIVSAMCMLTKCDAAILRSYEPETETLRLKAGFGVSQQWWDKNKIKYDKSIAKDAFEKERPLIINDIDTYSKHQGRSLLKSHKFQTMIMIPLMVSGKFLGSLSLYAKDSAKFRLIETDFLQNMGKQCSLAISTKQHS